MKILLIRRQEDSGQKQIGAKLLAFRADSYVRHMDSLGVDPEDYDKVYELAVAIYNEKEIKGPFGVDFMVQAVHRLRQKPEVDPVGYTIYQKPERNTLVSCTTCQGSKLAYKTIEGKIVGIQRDAEGKFLKCPDCE